MREVVSRCRYLKELLIFYGRKNSRYPNNWRKSKEVSEEISKWNAQFLQKTRHFTSHTPRHRCYHNEIKCKNVISLRFNGKIYLNVSKIKILNKVEKTSLRKSPVAAFCNTFAFYLLFIYICSKRRSFEFNEFFYPSYFLKYATYGLLIAIFEKLSIPLFQNIVLRRS